MYRRLSLLAAVTFANLFAQPVQILTSELPPAMVGTRYDFKIETGVDKRCPSGDVSLSVSDGALPRGFQFRGEELTGTPKETGTFPFAVRASNTCSSAVKNLELTVTGKPIIKVFPGELSFVQHVGQAVPASMAVQVSASWPNLPYAARSDVPWITQHVRDGVTPDNHSGYSSDAVSVQVDPKNLAPGVYHGTIKFSTWLGANSPAVEVTLTVVPL